MFFSEEHILTRMLGRGTQSTIKRGTWRGKPCAFKNFTDMDYVLEPFLLLSLCHENIISAYDVTGMAPGGIKLVLELADCDLAHHIEKNNPGEKERLEIFNSLLCAVSYLHKNGIYHGDIKVHNGLMVGGKLKLADFGSATIKDGKSKLCTLWVCPPQVLNGAGKPYSREKADIWALGVTFFHILTGQHLFAHDSMSNLRESLNKFLLDREGYLSLYDLKQEHKEMLLCMLEKEEEERKMPSFTEKHLYPPPLFKDRVPDIPSTPKVLEKIFSKTKPTKVVRENAVLLYSSLPQDMQNVHYALACYSLCYRLQAPYPTRVMVQGEYYNTRTQAHEERIFMQRQGLVFFLF